jgi:hypothetical protein
MSENVVKNINSLAIKMLISGIEAHKDALVLEEIKEKTGFDYIKAPTIVLFSQYLAVLDYLAKKFFPNKPLYEACEWMGYRISKQYIENPVGKVLATAGKVLGAEKGSRFVLKAIEIFIPEVKHEYEEVRSNYSRYHYYNLTGSPGVMAGIHRAAIEIVSTKNVKVTVNVISPNEAILENSWD